MRFTRLILTALIACGTAAYGAAKDYPVTPVPFTSVHVTGGFWQQKMTVAVDDLVPADGTDDEAHQVIVLA